MNTAPLIEIDGISHSYGERTALRDVSMEVASGALFGVLGPNGGGKTTLFRILSTLLAPTSGAARIDGCDVVADRAAVRGKIGVVFQSPSVDGQLTSRENLLYHGRLYGMSRSFAEEMAARWLDRFGVADRADDRVAVLSGGLRRRVELAKAMMHQPQLLILDEPSTGLDPGARNALTARLKSLCRDQGVTVLLTTHLMDEADDCDRIAVIDEGRLIRVESPEVLKASIGGQVIRIPTSESKSLAPRIAERFDVSAEAVDGAVYIQCEEGRVLVPRLMEAFPEEIASITVGKPTLEDVFLHLTGHRLWGRTGFPPSRE
jgi:ABC-2 type transport system ATP-binding protein